MADATTESGLQDEPRRLDIDPRRARKLVRASGEVAWDRVETAEDFATAAILYFHAYTRAVLKVLGPVLMKQDQLEALDCAWQQSNWFADLDAVYAIRDGKQPWTSLLPPTTPATSDAGRRDG